GVGGEVGRPDESIPLAVARYCRKYWAAGEIRAAGIWFPGKLGRAATSRALGSAEGSLIAKGKIPFFMSSVGARRFRVWPRFWRVPSTLAKKNALSFRIGPPRLAPNWCR